MTDALPTIAVLGGTEHEGWGLALRWACAGYPVIIGSRSAEKADEAAAEIGDVAREQLTPVALDFDRAELERRSVKPVADQVTVQGMAYRTAVEACDIAVMTDPFFVQRKTVEELKSALTGKILLDVTGPLGPPKDTPVQLPESGTAVADLQEFVGENIRVVSAFQNIAPAHLRDPDHDIACDVLVCGDDQSARSEVIKLSEAAGMKSWHGGPIANSAAVEALTSLLLFINRNYGIDGSGFQITGTPSKNPD